MHRAFIWHINRDRILSAEFAGVRLIIEPDPGLSQMVRFRVGLIDADRTNARQLGAGSAADVKTAMAEAETVAWNYVSVEMTDR